ncbi:MAG: hypothetical protein LQ352_004428 [Teloschistes flavicans]|nr:MAG: hypothetical protein LQ352_004428 [Teloschistes flavicans]
MTNFPIRPGLRIVLSLAALILRLSLYFTSLESLHGETVQSLKRSAAIRPGDYESPVRVPSAYKSSTAEVPAVALRFGRPDHPLEFSQPHVPHGKRASSSLTYQSAVCKGQEYYNMVLDTYAKADEDPKNNQGTEFGESDIDNGWSRTTIPWGEDMRQDWQGAFSSIAAEAGPQPSADLTKIQLRQDTEFTSVKGNAVPSNPQADQASKAHYLCAYSPQSGLIIAQNTASPTNEIRYNHQGISDADLQRLLPPLNRFSDAFFTVWKDLNGFNLQNARKLRYLGRSQISNPDTRYIMRAVFFGARRLKLVPWPGVTFSMRQDPGLALLGTPNGLAAAWLLIDHHGVLGKRDLKVTVWTYNSVPVDVDGGQDDDDDVDAVNIDYYMLWDFGDPNGVPTFQDDPPSSTDSARL